jgi:hypothetical protein
MRSDFPKTGQTSSGPRSNTRSDLTKVNGRGWVGLEKRLARVTTFMEAPKGIPSLGVFNYHKSFGNIRAIFPHTLQISLRPIPEVKIRSRMMWKCKIRCLVFAFHHLTASFRNKFLTTNFTFVTKIKPIAAAGTRISNTASMRFWFKL